MSTIDKTQPEWASQLADRVVKAKEFTDTYVSDSFAHLGPLIRAVGTTEAQVAARFKVYGLVADDHVFVTLSEAEQAYDITLYQEGDTRLAGAAALSTVSRERMNTLRQNLGVLVAALEDALAAKAEAILAEAEAL